MIEEKEEERFEEDSEMYENFRITVDKGQSLLRIDKFLMSRIERASRNKIQNAAKAQCILVDNIPVKQNYRVKPGNVISILLPEPPREIEIIPQQIPIHIVYEDNDIIVVDKQPGLVVHPGYGNYTGTLLNALTFHFMSSCITKETSPIPYLVHRIDKNTSGLLLVAKNELAQTFLAKQFYEHSIERKYLALVWGSLKEDEGTITGNLGRHPKDRKVMTVFPDGAQGKHAITHYKVIEHYGYTTFIECVLETGRTHQIRAHLKYIGHPLFNDEVYGGDKILKGTTFSKYKSFVLNCFELLPRQALHAASLGFIHPTTGQKMHFESTFPEDMQTVIDKWKKYSLSNKQE